jgi:hypothetical protein
VYFTVTDTAGTKRRVHFAISGLKRAECSRVTQPWGTRGPEPTGCWLLQKGGVVARTIARASTPRKTVRISDVTA